MSGRAIHRAGAALALLGVFLRELAVSSFTVARAAFARELPRRSAVIVVPVDLRTDLGVVVLANLITLTPGTCSLHISDDRKRIFVHALDAHDRDAIVAGIKALFETRIRRIEG